MILIISGMHRSGTSLLTRTLNQLGLYLGPEEKMMPASADNPEGFWEHMDFVKINNELLEQFGGAWDFVPAFPENWNTLPSLDPFYERARVLLSAFEDQSFWGWKDPRNSLTLPFWQKLLPDAHHILVIRHPLEVAKSLHKRNFFSLVNGLNLWKQYNEHWLQAAQHSKNCIVHYEALLFNAEQELQRVMKKLGLELSADEWENAKSVIKPNMKHHWVDQNTEEFEKRFPEVFNLYQELCQMAEYEPEAQPKVQVQVNESVPEGKQTEKSTIEYQPEPIFVVGCHRSGTSVLAHSLGRHSQTWIGEESNFISMLAKQAIEAYHFGTQRGERHWLSAQGVALDEFLFYLGLGINALYTQRAGGKRWIEQTPEYTLDALLLAKMFPGAAFVNIVRDGRDVVQSMINSGFSTKWAKDFKLACETWAKFVIAGLNFEAQGKSKAVRVYYEWLKKQPEQQFKKLAQQLNLPFEKSLAELFARGKVINSSFSNKQKQTWQESWSSEQRNIFNQIAGQLLISLGYEEDDQWVHQPLPETRLPEEDVPANAILAELNPKKQVPVLEEVKTSANDNSDNLAKVSIVIPLYNKLELTHQCLKSILQNTRYPNYELIFVDNGSTDDTAKYLQNLKLKNVKIIINEQNLGFVGGCNKGAEQAEGEFILFLNNDTQVTPGWLEALVKTMHQYPDCGIVGSKLVYPDGKLQEAGGIIFSDGNGWNYGRGMNPNDPRFNFVREVDYVSGASLMIRKSLWQKIGGFDQRYMPAYYEDTDLCFSAREHGFKVLYQPKSMVIHFEGQTAGTDLASGFKKYQQINHQKFVQKWKVQLKSQYENNPRNVPFASQRNVQQRILICDPLLPMWDRASGSLRLFNYIKILKKLGNHITFIARVGSGDPKYRETLQQLGVEVYENDRRALSFAGYTVNGNWPEIPYDIIFDERKFDLAIVSFWYLAEYYLPLIRKKSPATKIIVDTVDIHFVRELREAQLKKDKQLEKEALERKEREIQVYRQADRLWVVTKEDRRHIESYVNKIPIDVVPNIHFPVKVEKQFEQTSDLLFVGNFGHPPNIDAVQYFVKEIFPSVKKELGNIKFYIVGNNPPPEIQQLNGEDIVVTGFVPELKPYLVKARVSVSPLRYGAGMKGKIGEALSYGLPVVTTSIGAEGMQLIHEQHVLLADTADDFARQVIRLYKDRELWEKLSQSGKQLIEDQWGPATTQKKLQNILTEVKASFATRPKVSIIMLTYNALDYTKKCVDSILQHTRIPYEIIFVDNGSSDGTVEYLNELKEKFGHFKVILNSKNRGFAGGNNQGAKRARGEYLLFLNNDVLVSDNWLEGLVQALEKDPQIGMVGPVTNHISGLQRLANIPYKDENSFHQFAAKVFEINKDQITPRRRLAGFCVLMPKKLFEKVKGFDENFGTGNFEDDDLCVRVRQKGFALMVHEGVFIHHYGSQSFKANQIPYDTSLKQKSKIFFKKHPDIDYEELLELRNPLSEVHPRLKEEIKTLLNGGNFKQAEKICHQVLNENPLDDESWFLLALVYKSQQNYQNALAAVNRILVHDAQNPGALNLKGEILLAQHKYEAAKFLFDLALTEKPDYLDARRNLAYCHIENNEFEEGIKLLNQNLDQDPNDLPTLLYFAHLYLEAEKYQEAAQMLNQVLTIDPQNEFALQMQQLIPQDVLRSLDKQQEIEKAMQALNNGQAEEAKKSFENLKKEEPDNIEVQYGYALALQMLDDLDGAKEQLEKVVQLNADFVLAWNDLARIEFLNQNYEKAKEYYEKSLAISDDQINIKNQLSETLFALGEYEAGVQLLIDALKQKPDDVQTLKHLAAIYQEVGNEDMAKTFWQKVLKLNPDDQEALSVVGQMA